jgi:hypothetical protein
MSLEPLGLTVRAEGWLLEECQHKLVVADTMHILLPECLLPLACRVLVLGQVGRGAGRC